MSFWSIVWKRETPDYGQKKEILGSKYFCAGIFTKNIDVLFSGLVCAWRFCDLSPCQNNGECKNLNQSYSCSCDEGFAGKNCQVNLTHCASVSCSRRGQCRLDQDDNISCKCDENWRGKISELGWSRKRQNWRSPNCLSCQISCIWQF